MGSIDGVKMFVESTVTSDHVKDGSVARFVLNVVVVELTNDGELIRSVFPLQQYECCMEEGGFVERL